MAAAVTLARQYKTGEFITVLRISEHLGISKIYLEQIFSLLKRGGVVISIKGSQGGYQLARAPGEVTALEILSAVEGSLFEETQRTVPETAPDLEAAMREVAFDPLDRAVRDLLCGITLDKLVSTAEEHRAERAPMFYI